MKKILILGLILVISVQSFATNYYIATSGNDNNTNTISTPWKTIARLNSSFGSIQFGDSILFRRGDTFVGSIVCTKSGSSVSPIVISAYGTGAKPIISGFTTLTGWIPTIYNNIWQCNASILKANVNVLTVDGIPQAVGRTPNTTFYKYQTATSTQMASTDLAGLPNYVGGQLVLRENGFRSSKTTITAQTSSTVTFSNNTQPIDNGQIKGNNAGKVNFGYFFQRSLQTLDQQNEWYYNDTTGIAYIYSTVNPSAFVIKASYIDTLLVLSDKTYTTVNGVAFEGGGLYDIESVKGSNITIKNCTFNNQTRALYFFNTSDVLIDSNEIYNSMHNAVLVSNLTQHRRVTVSNNNIENTGVMLGMATFPSSNSGKGIVVEMDEIATNTYLNIINNSVYNTGYSAIQFQGSNVRVRYNVINRYCFNQGDGGGIYTWINNLSVNTTNYVDRIVEDNLIFNAIGDALGSPSIQTIGLYMDDQTLNVIIRRNIIWNIPGNGMSLNNPKNQQIYDNIVFNCNNGISIVQKPFGALTGNIIKKNTIYGKTAKQFHFFHRNENTQTPTPITITQSVQGMALIDSNYLSSVKASPDSLNYNDPAYHAILISLANWRSTYGKDINSTLPPVTQTVTNTQLQYNATSSNIVISFTGLKYIDPKGNVYENSLVLTPRQGVILIDNGVASSNQSPVANAGADKTIVLPVTTATANGGGTDVDGTISGYSWIQIFGPSAATIVSSTTATTTINGLNTVGVYRFELTVTDNGGKTAKDTMQVFVLAAPNVAPTCSAGTDSTTTLPKDSTTLIGTAADSDGSIVSILWTKIGGSPAGGTIVNPNSLTTKVLNLQAGTYSYQITVTDDGGLTKSDIVIVTVNPANIAPTVTVSADTTITLPATTASLRSYAKDVDGTISSYSWIKVAGPTGGTIMAPTSAFTSITALQQGVYVFEITVTDNSGATKKASIQVTVNPAIPPSNIKPVAHAGTDSTITLPKDSVTLIGSGTDADGTITDYLWYKISGPVGGTIVSSTNATTKITGLPQGQHLYQLRVRDNIGDSAVDQVLITVNAANILPNVDAGVDKVITLPVNTVNITGTANDVDGSISSVLWTRISGSGTISSPSSLTTNITNLSQGVSLYRLTVTDNSGATNNDVMQITVLAPENIAPTANAGVPQSIALPIDSVFLVGSGNDTDGSVSVYTWVQTSGAFASIISGNSASTWVKNLTQGTYVFSLVVTDNLGLQSIPSTVTITVTVGYINYLITPNRIRN